MPEKAQPAPAPKSTEISDLSAPDGENVKGGAIEVPCVRNRQIIPCVSPHELEPCLRRR